MKNICDSISRFIYKKISWIMTNHREKITEQYKMISIVFGKDLEKRVDEFYINQISSSILILVTVLVISGLFIVFNQFNSSSDIQIERNNYGEESALYSFEDVNHSLGNTINVYIEPVVYTPEEIEEISKSTIKKIDKSILKQNKSFEQIKTDINLITDSGYPGIEILWERESPTLIDVAGKINNATLEKKITTSVTAKIVYGEEVCSKEYTLEVYPKTYTAKETQIQEIVKEIQSISKENSDKKIFNLPTTINGVQLRNSAKRKNIGGMIVAFGIVIIILKWIKEKEEIKKRVKERNQEILLEYPNFINKLVLLLGAGMSIKGSLYKMTQDYRQKREQGKGNQYLYEELLVTINEIDAGLSETIAYFNFGRRIKLGPYLKTVTLIIQNIRLGTKGLLPLLEQEEAVAFDTRKENAKKQGEMISTKLLIPMILQMLIVMFIIMIPALLKFNL